MPVIDYATAANPEAAEIGQAIRARRGGQLLNLDRMLLHSPHFAAGWNAFLGATRTQLSLSPRLRELVTCAVGVLNGADYEVQQHTHPYLQAGGSMSVVELLARDPSQWERSSLLDATEQAALALARAMTQSVQIPGPLMQRMRSQLPSDQQLVELVGVIAAYNMVSRFLVALGIELETSPKDGIGSPFAQ
jgi:alkylhydroperoxidase family enzyme